ncbi:MAG: HAMP domain-containing sensor histidine kinase [Vicinamibacteraceae bacterium]
MGADSPLLPLVGTSIGLLGLVGILVFAVLKLRKVGREKAATGADRLSEEAFAAATIQAALGGQSVPSRQPAAAAGVSRLVAGPGAGDTVDGAVLDALPLGLIVTDEAGVVRRCTAAARQWLAVEGTGTGHPYRTTFTRWPAIANGLAGVHAGDEPVPFVLATSAAPSLLTVTVVRWVPRTGRGGAVAVLTPAAAATASGSDEASTAKVDDGLHDARRLASGLAHELANSLTTVHGYAHMVDRGSLNEADRSALEHITTSSEKMLTTVEAFRALVRPLPVSLTTFAPVEAVKAAIALARQEAERPDADVQLTSAPTGTVTGDRVLLEEAIAAVIKNAIEASAQITPAPRVMVSVGQVAGERRVDVVVTDRGPGVPEDIRASVFEPFRTDKPGHAGLGLARAAQVLRAHSGASMALSHPAGAGLVVTITLPSVA